MNDATAIRLVALFCACQFAEDVSDAKAIMDEFVEYLEFDLGEVSFEADFAPDPQ